MLRRYWFIFEGDARSLPAGLAMGCGVTAPSQSEAMRMISEDLLAGDELPTVTRIVVDVDVSALDPDHVLPNVGPPDMRGIWFPRQ